METDRVLDRVRKLLRLAGHAGSEAEAALAADRAAQLMAEHEIHEAQLRLDDPDSKPEEIITQGEVPGDNVKRRVAWKSTIAGAVARSFGCQWYWSGCGQVRLFGRLSVVQAVGYTTAYLWNEVDRITDQEWALVKDQSPDWQSTKAWKNAFRLGAASRLSTRLHDTTSTSAPVAVAVVDGESLPEKSQPPDNSLALVVVQREREEVKSSYAEFSKKFGRASAIGTQVRSRTAFQAGQSAANGIALSASGRPRLNKGTEVLP